MRQGLSPAPLGASIGPMTTEGWIFMVGFRVFDVGLLVAWLIWFFRLRDDGDEPPGDDGGGGEGPGPRPEQGRTRRGRHRFPLGRWPIGRGRDRDHSRPAGPGPPEGQRARRADAASLAGQAPGLAGARPPQRLIGSPDGGRDRLRVS